MSARGQRTMRAAVLVDVGRIEVRDVPLREPLPTELLVRVEATGLCGTDVHIVHGHANYNRDAHGNARPLSAHPQILGHEISGIVHEAGAAVSDVTEGDRVIIDQGITCVSESRIPRCEYCETGDSHQCAHYREHGITDLPGGFAEFITVPAVNTVTLRSGIAPEQAALAEPLGCIVHSMDMLANIRARYSMSNSGDVRRAQNIMICGAGPAGLLFAQYLRSVVHFEGMILQSDPNPMKRSLAEHFGAVTLDPSSSEPVSQVREMTRGRGVEIIIEASGAGEVFTMIPGLLRKQGTLLMYGHGHAGVDLSVLNDVQFLEPALIAPAGASGGHDATGRPLTYQMALRLIEDGTIDVGRLITHRYASLEQVPSAFAGDYGKPEYIKGVILQ